MVLNFNNYWLLNYSPTPGTCGSSWTSTWTWGSGSTRVLSCVVCLACRNGSLMSGPGMLASPTCWRLGGYQGEREWSFDAKHVISAWVPNSFMFSPCSSCFSWCCVNFLNFMKLALNLINCFAILRTLHKTRLYTKDKPSLFNLKGQYVVLEIVIFIILIR